MKVCVLLLLLSILLILSLTEGKNIGRHPRRHGKRTSNETEEVNPFRVIVNAAGQAIRTLTKSSPPPANATALSGENKLQIARGNNTSKNGTATEQGFHSVENKSPLNSSDVGEKSNGKTASVNGSLPLKSADTSQKGKEKGGQKVQEQDEQKGREQGLETKSIPLPSSKTESKEPLHKNSENVSAQNKQVKEHNLDSKKSETTRKAAEKEGETKTKSNDVSGNIKERKKDAKPDPEAMLHGDGGHAHDDNEQEKEGQKVEERKVENFAVDLESALHSDGGHVHDHPTKETTGGGAKKAPKYDVDMEGMLHGGDTHAHEHGPQGEATERGDFTTDPESMLHGEGSHSHEEHAAKSKSKTGKKIPVVGASDLDSMLHGGDSHAHEHGPQDQKSDTEKSGPIGVADPEEMLHGLDGRPHSHDKKPTADKEEVGIKSKDIVIGKLAAEDVEDYQRWKKEKKSNQTAGWNFGFSFISDTLMQDLVSAKNRYLDRFWGNTTGHNETHPNTHDEA